MLYGQSNNGRNITWIEIKSERRSKRGEKRRQKQTNEEVLKVGKETSKGDEDGKRGRTFCVTSR